MKRFAYSLALVGSILTGCLDATEADQIDDVTDDLGKADSESARHYLLQVDPDDPNARVVTRAGGGKLRCPDGVIATSCPVEAYDLLPGSTLPAAEIILDELEDHPIIARGAIVHVDDRIAFRFTAVTRGITSVLAYGTCYRMRTIPQKPFSYTLERLDYVAKKYAYLVNLESVDPTPDFWGQPTPAVQAKIDAGLALIDTRPVYTCGDFTIQGEQPWFFGSQLFVPKT